MSAAVAKGDLGGRGAYFDCKDEFCEDMGQWDSQVFADSRGTGAMDPFLALSEVIVARVPIPPSAPVPASTHALSCPTGRHVPAPGPLPPRLFALPDSAQLPPSAAIPTLSVRASSFRHGPISPLAPRFSPISLPHPPPSPSPYPALQLPEVSLPTKPYPLSLLILLAVLPLVFSFGHQGLSPGHCPSWIVPSRDEVPNPRMPQQPTVGKSNIKSVPWEKNLRGPHCWERKRNTTSEIPQS